MMIYWKNSWIILNKKLLKVKKIRILKRNINNWVWKIFYLLDHKLKISEVKLQTIKNKNSFILVKTISLMNFEFLNYIYIIYEFYVNIF